MAAASKNNIATSSQTKSTALTKLRQIKDEAEHLWTDIQQIKQHTAEDIDDAALNKILQVVAVNLHQAKNITSQRKQQQLKSIQKTFESMKDVDNSVELY